jgi:hypothetical protein
LNVGKDYSGPFCFRESHGFCMRPGNAKHAMSQAFHQPFEVESDKCFIFNNQHIGCDLGGELTPRLLDKIPQGRRVDVEHLCGIVLRKPLKCDQKEGLTRLRRNLRQMPFDWLTRAGGARLSVEPN